jgi:hypothetical protein
LNAKNREIMSIAHNVNNEIDKFKQKRVARFYLRFSFSHSTTCGEEVSELAANVSRISGEGKGPCLAPA